MTVIKSFESGFWFNAWWNMETGPNCFSPLLGAVHVGGGQLDIEQTGESRVHGSCLGGLSWGRDRIWPV